MWQGYEYVSGYNYGRVLNIPGFRVCQVSAHATVAQGSEYAWIWQNDVLPQGSGYVWSTFHRPLDKPLVLNMLRLRIWLRTGLRRLWISKGYKGCWIWLNKLEYSLIMSQYWWIYFNNAEYDWICQCIPEKTECWICQNYSQFVWCTT